MFSVTLIAGNTQCYVILVGFYLGFIFWGYKLHTYNLTTDLLPQHYIYIYILIIPLILKAHVFTGTQNTFRKHLNFLFPRLS